MALTNITPTRISLCVFIEPIIGPLLLHQPCHEHSVVGIGLDVLTDVVDAAQNNTTNANIMRIKEVMRQPIVRSFTDSTKDM